MSNILIRVEHMFRGNLIFPLECQQQSLVMEPNVVMSSLGKLPDFMPNNQHKHKEAGQRQTPQRVVPALRIS